MTDITTHNASRRRLLIALSITFTFMIIQLVGAYFSNSLAVLADAGHLFVHNSSLFIALIASSLAIRLSNTFNDGYKKVEHTGGLINGLLYLTISIIILVEGVNRFTVHSDGHQVVINTYLMSVISAVGFLFHGASAWVLYKGRKDSINVYAVFLHSFFDLISTVSTFITGILIHITGFEVIDIISSMVIALFVLYTGIKVIRICLNNLFNKTEALPNIDKIEQLILSTEHVESVHNVTVSQLDGEITIGAHIVLKYHCTVEHHDEKCRREVDEQLLKKFAIKNSVLQIESPSSVEPK